VSKKRDQSASKVTPAPGWLVNPTDPWRERILAVANRFNRDYQRESFDLPAEVEAMPIFRSWATGELQTKTASRFWELVQPQKQQHCLDIGCGLSFLIYPWREWNALFWGQDISKVAQEALNSRGPQLNSKLFKGVTLGPAHELAYDAQQFDLVIATGWSCYFPLEYWQSVVAEVKRVLKPGGQFLFDVLDPDTPLAENWAILETYLGAEVCLEPLPAWEQTLQAAAGQIRRQQAGELFHLYSVRFGG
jgi:SAM-dependent methyltransferase